MSTKQTSYCLAMFALFVMKAPLAAQEVAKNDVARLSHFESKIRPALHEHCLNCHHQGKKNGGLALDSREGWQIGGDSGPAIVPGKPDESLLLRTIMHLEAGLEMPAKAPQLDKVQIEEFRQWIAEGAKDPREQPEPLGEAKLDWDKLFEDRSKWWCWQPNPVLGKPTEFRGIDYWLDQKIKEAAVISANEAAPHELVRRLSFQLRGLPPAYADIEKFSAAPNQESWSKLVDQYLESDEFAEHWARHWMDTVRYSETHGSEDDAYLPFAYRYRDYVVRAFKEDIPVNRFIEEHLAGDLIEARWNEQGINEALVGLAFWRFIEFNQTPVDVKKEEIVVIDSQIDAVGKTFQGITISCARCHDHKFDPISDEDYYSLYGILRSTRSGLRVIDRPEVFTQQNKPLEALQVDYTKAWSGYWLKRVDSIEQELAAAAGWLKQNVKPDAKWQDIEKSLPQGQLVLNSLARLRHSNATSGVKQIVANLVDVADDEFVAKWKQWQTDIVDNKETLPTGANLLFDVTRGDLSRWRIDGAGLPDNVVQGKVNWSIAGNRDASFTSLLGEGYHSNRLSDRHSGILRSPDFVVESDAISLLCRGTAGARARLVIENFQGDSLLFETVNPSLNSDNIQWITMTIRPQWKGLRAHIEFLTRDAKPYVGVTKDPSYLERSDGRSSFGVLKIVAHRRDIGMPEYEVVPRSLSEQSVSNRTEAMSHVVQAIAQSLGRLQQAEASPADVRWLNVWISSGLLTTLPVEDSDLSSMAKKYRELESKIPQPRWAPGVYEDRLPVKQAWLPRGDHRSPGQELDRGYLVALKDVSVSFRNDSGGRLELARSIANPQNPLTARVYVNRVWNWLFGEGLVRSVDNFGRMGDVPSHPELLDELAARFIDEGWSTKKLIHHIVQSKAWRRSSTPTASAQEKDADNRLWSHMIVRRIDAESIRDSMLLMAGNLKRPDSGLGTQTYYQAVMEPNKQSPPGPLDGDGRRSIYLEVRRNFPYDFLLSFDFPRPASPVGKRSTTVVPTQSLTLLNDPLVVHESKLWGAKVAGSAGEISDKIRSMFCDLLGREPTENELQSAVDLWEQVKSKEGPEAAWHVLAHGMFNLKEFIFLR